MAHKESDIWTNRLPREDLLQLQVRCSLRKVELWECCYLAIQMVVPGSRVRHFEIWPSWRPVVSLYLLWHHWYYFHDWLAHEILNQGPNLTWWSRVYRLAAETSEYFYRLQQNEAESSEHEAMQSSYCCLSRHEHIATYMMVYYNISINFRLTIVVLFFLNRSHDSCQNCMTLVPCI